MFGFVTASTKTLTEQQLARYGAVYCGICHRIHTAASNMARLTLQYDMAFLALLLMSLYEPEETGGDRSCLLHPLRKHPWTDNAYIAYAADMNVALAYYKCLDDWEDDRKLPAKAMAGCLEKYVHQIAQKYPRQCTAISQCIRQLRQLEEANCGNPDLPANCFGRLMEQLLICREDLWAQSLGEMGMALGRFIYLMDAVEDYRADLRKKKYNPLVAAGTGEDFDRWEEYLVLAMARCTEAYEKLPLVQDKALLDNILYSGVWARFSVLRNKRQEEKHGSGSL